ncbi:MAG: N-formylglutamate amidohydrolase [Pseudomonadota bacterium]
MSLPADANDPINPVSENLSGDAGCLALLVCEHAGVGIPEHLQGRYPSDLMSTHYGSDLGSRALTIALAERLAAPALCAHYSRIVIDCNRRLDDPTLFLPEADGLAVTANHALSTRDRHHRVHEIYAPWHAAVESALQAQCAISTDLLYVAVHSFTPVLNGRQRPWDAGLMWDVDDRVATEVGRHLKKNSGLTIGMNEPYSGKAIQDFSIDFHAERQGFSNISIEVRQDHLATDAGVQAWADRLAAALRPFVQSPPARLATATESAPPTFATDPGDFLETAGQWGVQRAS